MNLIFETNRTAKEPEKAHKADAGLDLFVNSYELKAYNDYVKRYDIDTGVRLAIPENHVGLILPRSSVSKAGVLTHTGVIDSGYTGLIHVFLTIFDPDFSPFIGEKIAQLVLLPLTQYDLIKGQVHNIESERGSNGFGSTGA